MSVFSKPSNLAVLLLILPSVAHADADTALTLGSGPDGYRSYALKADADFSESAQLNLDYFLAKSTGVDDTRRITAGLTWYATELVSANYSHANTNDGTLDITGNEVGLSFALNELWHGELRTSVDLGYGASSYKPAVQPAGVNGKKLKQNLGSIGLSQDITSTFTVYGSHDQYKYDRNPSALAIRLIRRTRNTSQTAFTLLGFPDKANTLGMTWKPLESLKLDISSGRATTPLEQQQKNTRLGMDYQFDDSLNIAASVTRANSTAVTTAGGVTVQPATSDTYTELTLGWDF
jgi:hypothetical protein